MEALEKTEYTIYWLTILNCYIKSLSLHFFILKMGLTVVTISLSCRKETIKSVSNA